MKILVIAQIFFLLQYVVQVLGSTNNKKCLIGDQKNASVYRLGQALIPENYNISLIFKEDFHKTLHFFVEKCSIKINIKPNKLESEVQKIRFHYNSTIPKNKVTLVDKNNRSLNFNISDFELCSQIIEITLLDENLDKNLQPYTLIFLNLVGDIRLDNFGVYLGEYLKGGRDQYVVATQFQAPKARFNFPCFDEPAMKATFDISITAPRAYNTVIGNTKILRQSDLSDFVYRKIIFNTTSRISTYLLAYVVSSFESVSVRDNEHFKVFFTQGESISAQYALELLPKIVESMENIFGIKYIDMGNDQLSQVALPECSASEIETVGMNLYRESVLLSNPNFATNFDRQNVLTYMGLGIAHMWIGNYLSVEWWSHLWITEGSAKYFSYYATADVEPDNELKQQFIITVVQAAFEKDGVLYEMPLTSKDEDILNWKEISKKSTALTAEKGASIIRMIEHIIGTDSLKRAYHKFLQENKWSNAKTSDFIQAFEAEGLPSGIMREWTEEVGYPVVSVKKVTNSAVLTQRKFSIQNFRSSLQWYIPITYASAAHNKEFNTTRPANWLEPNEELILENVFTDNIKWIIVNVQVAGYYRVNYEENLWVDILQALRSENFGGIPAINRAQLINDVLSMARAMRQSYKLAMDVTKYLERETDYYPWATAYNAFHYLLIRIGKRKTLNTLVKRYILKLQNKVSSNSYDIQKGDKHIEILKKVMHIEWACRCGCEKCISTIKKQFELYKTDPKKFNYNPNLHYVIFCNAVRYGTVVDWDFLYGQYKLSRVSTEKKKLLEALGCSRNPAVLMRFLELTVTPNSTIRKQDRYRVFRAVVKTNVDVANDFFKLYISEISYTFSSYNALTGVLEELISRFSTIAQIQDFKRFVQDNHNYFHEADGDLIESLVKTAEVNIKWLTIFEDELTEWLTQEVDSSSSKRTRFNLVIFLIVCNVLFLIY